MYSRPDGTWLMDSTGYGEKLNQFTVRPYYFAVSCFYGACILSKQVGWNLFSQRGCKTKACVHRDKTVRAAASLVERIWLLHKKKVLFTFCSRKWTNPQHCSCECLFIPHLFPIAPLSSQGYNIYFEGAASQLMVFILKLRESVIL